VWKFLKKILLALGLCVGEVGVNAQTCGLRDNGDGTLTAPYSGIHIQKCAVGQKWSGVSCTGSPSMLSFDQAVALPNQGGWRLITFEEGNKVRLETGQCPDFKVVQGTLTSSTLVNTFNNKKAAQVVNFFWSTTGGLSFDERSTVILVRAVK
jgi:hypothetical protein